MTQLRQNTPSNASRKFWVQLLVFAALALLFYLKPRIESWVQAQQRGATSAESTAVDSTSDADEPAERYDSGSNEVEANSSVTEAEAKSDSESSPKQIILTYGPN